jgi:hypothetical protein
MHAIHKEIIQKKEFPSQVTPTIPNLREKYFDAAYRRHKLVYCRTSPNDTH